ncbi:hypothetical protein M231_04402 [Tremella mesenterica]|uniref:acylphosphatase n=1 Tax=Tremella mesenterica TaxID=5217 RepID=A0A4Q1BL13_TREME|nr:hypothetical protein M231_04402 [Tremella mesenterica]
MVDLIEFKVSVRHSFTTRNELIVKSTGVVQGVNFRSFVQRRAKDLGLRGWCWNHPDKSVEGVVVGPSDNVRALKRYLEQGPPAAEVHKVEMIKEISGASESDIEAALDGAKGFEVRRHSFKK